MALPELDDLFNLVNAADRAQLETILNNNEAAKTALVGRETVYQAFVTGDDAALDKLPRQQAQPTTTPASPSRQTPAALDIAALDAELTRRMPTMLKSYLDSPDAQAAIDARAKTIAEAALKAATPDLIGRGMKSADEIYTIRDTHAREFGEQLDSAAFEKFVIDNTGKYASLSAAHDAMVQDKRIEHRIDKGVTEKLAAQRTSEVPGTSLPTSQSPLGVMIRDNAKRTGAVDVARGQGLDDAARAFRDLQNKHAVN